MQINSSLTKPITETRYLTAENCWRYRVILRFFYLQYEKIKYWMYKEEIFEELKKHPHFESYTMEQCQQDLAALVDWGNLVPVQDTSRASTVEEFKNKQFRYQLSEYSVEIERLTIKLENIFVEGASLEPTLLERIKDRILKIAGLAGANPRTVGLWWRDLNTDFKRLNQNYQDYVRSFYSQKAEELMKAKEFISYKDALIDYLREFVKELQKNVHVIESSLRKTPVEDVNKLIAKVLEYEKSIPRLDMEINEELMTENIKGRWTNFRDWFLGTPSRESEASKIFDITNEIIRKITRYAAQIAESRNTTANRKEEYRKLCDMFLSCKSMDEAHKLSAVAFGLSNTKHIKGDFTRKTESSSSSVYDEDPFSVSIKPRIRYYREKSIRTAIEDKTEKKQRMFEKYIKNLEQEKNVLESLIKGGRIHVSELPLVDSHVRITLLKWISKACTSEKKTAKTEDGRSFRLQEPQNKERCILHSEDGDLEMPSYVLVFSESKDGGLHHEGA